MEQVSANLKYSDIFIPIPGKSCYSLQELSRLKIHAVGICELAKQLDLTYVNYERTNGNVCFNDNRDVRPEFRTSFNKVDLLNYIKSKLSDAKVNTEHDYLSIEGNFFIDLASTIMVEKISRIKEEKKQLREVMLAQRDKMPRDLRNTHSEQICHKLWDIIMKNQVKVIHSYLPMGSEVNLTPLLQKALEADIKVVVPKTLKKRQMQNLILSDLKNMEAGIFGTYHPRNAEEYQGSYDLIIVAGLAFSEDNYRVGYGGGYYDTFLHEQQQAIKVGVCYPFQFINKVPQESHDVKLDEVIKP